VLLSSSSWLTRSFDQYTVAWLLLSSIIGGVVGASVKFLFDDVLSPRLGSRRCPFTGLTSGADRRG
jgi:hypothetical protein